MKEKRKRAPAAPVDRQIQLLDQYLQLSATRRAGFCKDRNVTVKSLANWAQRLYGQGLRELTRQLGGA